MEASPFENSPREVEPSLEELSKIVLCPITQMAMEDPVVAPDGHSYERVAISKWLESRGPLAVSPMTGERLEHLELTSNTTLKIMIRAYLASLPIRQQKKLTEKDIEIAIQAREEELADYLAKHHKRLAELESRLGPMQSEIMALRKENEQLRRKNENEQASRNQNNNNNQVSPISLVITRREQEAGRQGRKPSARISSNPDVRVNEKAKTIKATEAQINEFLTAVYRGELDKVEACLRKNRNLVYAQGDLNDLSNRKFKRITAFQYAIWALDKEIWELLLKYLPESEAYDQLIALEQERSDITQIHGIHFDFSPLLNAYQNCIENSFQRHLNKRNTLSSWWWPWGANSSNDYYDTWKHWDDSFCREVGGAQYQMPAWFIYLFTEGGEDKAWPSNNFKKNFTRDPRCLFWWFDEEYNGGKLGIKWAAYRGNGALWLRGPYISASVAGLLDVGKARQDAITDSDHVLACQTERRHCRETLKDYLIQTVEKGNVSVKVK